MSDKPAPRAWADPLIGRIAKESITSSMVRATWERHHDKGSGLEVFAEVMANQPAAYAIYEEEIYPRLFYNIRGDMHVGQRYKELFRFKLGISHGCYLCNTSNWQTTRDAGFTQEQLDNALKPTPGLFTDAELAILDLAELFVLWNTDAQLTPDLYERLLGHFGDAGIVELGILGAFFMGFQRMLFAFDLVPREQSCPIAAFSEMAR
jgi:alkylhydroperoxidase family enzyme